MPDSCGLPLALAGLCIATLGDLGCGNPTARAPQHDAGSARDGAVPGDGGDGGARDGGARDGGSASDGSTVASDGAVVFGSGATWSFDEGSGATAGGDPLHGAPRWTAGEIGTALQFDGAADSVEVGHPAIDPQQSFSVAAWLRLDRLDSAAAILALNGQVTSSVTLGYWPASGSSAGGLGIALQSADHDGATPTRVLSPFTPVADVWYHLAATYDAASGRVQLYIDGNAVASGSAPLPFAAGGASSLGRALSSSAPASYWPGVLDEIHLAPGVWANSDVTALYGAAAAITPVRPPAVPLVVRGPYVSTWLPADAAPGRWPTFWTGAIKAMTGFVRVDGKSFLLIGAPTGLNASNATQLRLEVTATQSRYLFLAGGVHVYVDFISPVETDDIRRLSMPYGFVRVQALSVDGKTHDASLYFDISGEWAHGDPGTSITWSRSDVTASPGNVSAFAVAPASPGVLAESNDYASWGTAVWGTAASGIHFQAGSDTTVRALFCGGGTLDGSIDANQPRPINQSWPVFAYQADLGALAGTPSSPRYFVIGNVRQPAASYLGGQLAPLWQSYWGSWQSMLADGHADAVAGTLAARADRLDQEVAVAAVAAGGAHYAGLCALALRQAFGGVELVGSGADPWMFLKEISSDGNLSTVDVIYPSMPAFLWSNPLLVRYLLTPLLVYAESGKWPQTYAEHDLGASYPNAAGHNDGGGENMPVEESANMVLMTAAYVQAANSSDAILFVNSHYATLKQWSDYLVANLPDPGLQNQTDDFTGSIAHSSNLALKGILAIGAMGQIAAKLGQSADATHYAATAQSYISQWSTLSQDATATHLKLAYDQADTTWSLKYNSYPDRLLGLALIPPATLTEEASWYAAQKAQYGFPLDNRHTYTKADWELWTAAGVSDPALRQALVDTLYTFANETPSRVPLTDWYDTVAGTQNGFQARPVAGGLFSLMTLGASGSH